MPGMKKRILIYSPIIAILLVSFVSSLFVPTANAEKRGAKEAYEFYEMTGGFGGRIHPRHVR